MADFATFPARTQTDAEARSDAKAMAAQAQALIDAGKVKVNQIEPFDVRLFSERHTAAVAADAKARQNRGGNSAAKRSTRARATAWKNGVSP